MVNSLFFSYAQGSFVYYRMLIYREIMFQMCALLLVNSELDLLENFYLAFKQSKEKKEFR